MGRHPAFARYRGSAPQFPGDEFDVTRALVAEIVASEAARMVLERKYTSAAGAGLLDAANLYAEHSKYLHKYLSRCHRTLVPDPDRTGNGSLRRRGVQGSTPLPSIQIPGPSADA